MKVLNGLVLVFLLSGFVFSQTAAVVTGRLVSEGRAVAEQVVRLVSPTETFETRTDSDGNYRFENVPNGRYLLVYGDKRANVSVSGGVAAVAELASVVVVAADSPQTIDQISRSVDVIDGQEMRDRADFSLVDSLRTIPGFRVQQLGGFGRTASVKSRGLRNQDTAVLIDGIRFRDASAITGDASPFLSDFTLTSVSRIEVLRGPASSLYGTNAVGGTIDFRTPEARSGTHGQIGGAIGGLGLGRFRGNLSHGTSDGRFGIGGGVSRTVYRQGIDGDDAGHNTNFQARIDANPLSRTNISGRIFLSDADVQLNVNPDTLGPPPLSNQTIIDARPGVNFMPDANDPDSRQGSKFFNGQVVVTHAVNDGLILGGYYSGLTTRRENENGMMGPGFQPFGGNETYSFDGDIHTLNGRVDWTARQNRLRVVYEYELEKFGNEGIFAQAPNNFVTRARQSSNTFYIHDQLGLIDDRLQVSGGFRAQWFSLSEPTFSSVNFPNRFTNVGSPPASYTGDGSISYYFAGSGTKLRAHVGNGYRVPSLYERFGSYFFQNTFFGLGNPELRPERSFSVEAGVDQRLVGERVQLGATWFYTKISDEISFLPTDDLGGPSYFNFDQHFSRGLELSGDIRPTTSTRIFASYTYTNSDVRAFRRQLFLPPFNTESSDRSAFGVPNHQFTLVATQRFGRFWVNFDLLVTSDYLAPIFSNTAFSTSIYRFGGNRRGDLTAGYTFGFKNDTRSLRLFATVENLFDHEYYENGFRTVGANGRFGASFSF